MWKPPEKIRFKTSMGYLPDPQEIVDSKLFSPLDYQRLHLDNRSWLPAMVPWRATNDGEVTREVLDWYGRFARSKPAAIVVEATGIRDVPSGPLMRIGHDRYIGGLRQLIERIGEESEGATRVFIQLIDFLSIRRRQKAEKYLERFLVITDRHRKLLDMEEAREFDIRQALIEMEGEGLERILAEREYNALTYGARELVTDTHLNHIADLPQVLPQLFADAAIRAEEAGFDGVELHYAHAYSMASFLSATNNRQDGYGGERTHRVRLPREVFRKVRECVSDKFVVGARFLANEIIDGGSDVEDACFFAVEFARCGMDFLSLSRGGKFDDAKQPKVGAAAYPYTGRSGYECMPQFISDKVGPFGRNFADTAQVRKAVRDAGMQTPVVVAGGIHNFEMAEAALKGGKGDIIGVARQYLADPDWLLKLQSGHGEAIRLCEYTNYCEGLDQNHKQVTCKLWDRTELDEPDVLKSRDGKRRLSAPPWSAK